MVDPTPDLTDLRERIDALDAELVRVLAERIEVCELVAKRKEATGAAVIQPNRVREVIGTRRQWAIDAGIDPDFVEQVVRVLLAESGEEALKLLAKSDGVALALLSLEAGEATIRRMREIRAGLPVLVSSGYPLAEALARLGGAAVAGFLQKPYKAVDLVKRVEQILSARAAM